MSLKTVEFEIRGKPTAVLSQTRQQFPCAWRFLNLEATSAGYGNFDVIAFLQIQRLHYHRGQPNRQTVSPFSDLHNTSVSIDIH
jgi:hypothetical protein